MFQQSFGCIGPHNAKEFLEFLWDSVEGVSFFFQFQYSQDIAHDSCFWVLDDFFIPGK